MDVKTQNKVLRAGLTIIRKQDGAQPCIRFRQGCGRWRTLEKFTTAAARDRRVRELLHDRAIIEV